MQKGQKSPWSTDKPAAASPVEGWGDYPKPSFQAKEPTTFRHENTNVVKRPKHK